MEPDFNPAAEDQLDRLRVLADKLDCLIDPDISLLGNVSGKTVEAWNKRGTGPEYFMFGNRRLYPRKAFAQFLETKRRERRAIDVKAVL
jgi:hypothetical protein